MEDTFFADRPIHTNQGKHKHSLLRCKNDVLRETGSGMWSPNGRFAELRREHHFSLVSRFVPQMCLQDLVVAAFLYERIHFELLR